MTGAFEPCFKGIWASDFPHVLRMDKPSLGTDQCLCALKKMPSNRLTAPHPLKLCFLKETEEFGRKVPGRGWFQEGRGQWEMWLPGFWKDGRGRIKMGGPHRSDVELRRILLTQIAIQ